jgi:hypothetical protein
MPLQTNSVELSSGITLFDLYCLEMVAQVGTRLPTCQEEQASSADAVERQFRLFATWYFDGYEPFDRWVKDLGGLSDRSQQAMRQAVVDHLTRRLREKGPAFARQRGDNPRLVVARRGISTHRSRGRGRARATNEQVELLAEYRG